MELLELAKLLVKWIFDRRSRLVLRGYRPEVICLIQGTADPANYLMIRPQASRTVWAPPQEGLELDETLESAVKRCLLNELGLPESRIQYRKSAWIGEVKLPRERWDERELRHSLRGLFGRNRMVGKGYYAALIIADSDSDIAPNPAEVSHWEWLSAAEFARRLATNTPEKRQILERTWATLIGSPVKEIH